MALWSEGYFTDTEYTDGYYGELSPLWLNLNLTLAGFDIPVGGGGDICPSQPFNYLELGFGRGGSINAHAVTTSGNYVGTDFNPTQVAIAKEYIVSDNITLYDDSFKELLERFERERPQFDYIGFHGIFSWISKENQKIILEIIRKFLKVGGVVYNSYNCAPGWSSKMPSRELLKLHNDMHNSTQSNAESHIQESVQFLNDFLALNPIYAAQAPLNKGLVESIQSHSRAYIAHEYLNASWECFYFYQVAQLMEEAKCSFATSAMPLDHIDMCHFTDETLAFLNKVQNGIFKEQLKDYCKNTQFRKDIFVKGAHRISPRQREQRLLNTKFALIAPIKDFSYKVQCLRGELNLNKEMCDKIFNALEKDSNRAKTLQEIIESTKISFQEIQSNIILLIHQKIIAPVQEVTKEIAQRAKAYNDNTLAQNLLADTSHWVAAPSIAAGFAINNVDKILLYAYLHKSKKEADMVNFTLETLKSKGQGIIKEGKVLTDETESKNAIKEMAKKFVESLPLYKTLGIVE